MPTALAAMPRKMLPPPMTMATCTPSAVTSRTSAPTRSRTGGSIPYPWFPASASPESFRTIRRYTGRPSAPVVTRLPSNPEAGEPLDHHALPRLGVGQVDEVLDRRLARGVPDEDLLQQTLVAEELLEL